MNNNVQFMFIEQIKPANKIYLNNRNTRKTRA